MRLVLTEKFQKTKDQNELDQIIDFYINPINLKWINNWDLVDISCYKILGKYIFNNPQKIDILYNFAKSDNLWEKRIAIVSTLAFIKELFASIKKPFSYNRFWLRLICSFIKIFYSSDNKVFLLSFKVQL